MFMKDLRAVLFYLFQYITHWRVRLTHAIDMISVCRRTQAYRDAGSWHMTGNVVQRPLTRTKHWDNVPAVTIVLAYLKRNGDLQNVLNNCGERCKMFGEDTHRWTQTYDLLLHQISRRNSQLDLCDHCFWGDSAKLNRRCYCAVDSEALKHYAGCVCFKLTGTQCTVHWHATKTRQSLQEVWKKKLKNFWHWIAAGMLSHMYLFSATCVM